MEYPNGTKVQCVDPVWLDEKVTGVVVKNEKDSFLVKLDKPFLRTNKGKPWLTVYREYAEQYVEVI